MEKHSLLALWQWMDCGCTNMIQKWSVKLQNGILLSQHGESCIEIVVVLWKWCLLCFSPLKNLCCATKSHLTHQLVTHIVLLCCMIMCGLSSIQKITPAAKWCHHLPSDNVTPHHCHDIHSLQQDWDWEIPAHPAYSPTFAPYDFLLFPHMKEPLNRCRLNL